MTTTEPTVEQALAELRELFPRWKYFALTVAIGAPIRRFSLKTGPSFYSPAVKRFDEDTLSEAMARVRKWHGEQSSSTPDRKVRESNGVSESQTSTE